jgi:hypothetical protein
MGFETWWFGRGWLFNSMVFWTASVEKDRDGKEKDVFER